MAALSSAPLRVKIESFEYKGPPQERWIVQALRYYLLSELARFPEMQPLTVEQQDEAMRSLAEKQKMGESLDLEAESARILHADLRCAGSLQFDGRNFRLSLRLLRSPDFTTTQTASLDGARDDLHGFQTKILDALLAGLDIRLSPEQRKTRDAFTPRSQAAYEYYVQAAAAHQQGDFAGSLTMVQNALTADPEYLHALNLAGTLQLDLGRPERAVEIHQKRKAILETRGLSDSPAYAATLHNLARSRIAATSGNPQTLDEAMRLYTQANEILKRAGFGLSPDYATNLDGMGEVFLAQRDYKSAAEVFEAERTMQEKLALTDTAGYAQTLVDLARAYADLKEYQKAVALLEQTIALLRKRNLPGERQMLLLALRRSAKCYQADHKDPLALQSYEQANQLRRETRTGGDEAHAADLFQMAEISLAASKPEQALTYLAEEKTILDRGSKETRIYGAYLAATGRAYGLLDRYCEGAQVLKLARDIFARLPGEQEEQQRAARQMQTLVEFCERTRAN